MLQLDFTNAFNSISQHAILVVSTYQSSLPGWGVAILGNHVFYSLARTWFTAVVAYRGVIPWGRWSLHYLFTPS